MSDQMPEIRWMFDISEADSIGERAKLEALQRIAEELAALRKEVARLGGIPEEWP